MKMEQTECSETSAYKIQTPGNYPEESMQHSEQGESLNSGRKKLVLADTIGKYLIGFDPVSSNRNRTSC